MTKKGGSKHLKRLPAPVNWPIHRKEFRWVVKSRPGPHPLDRSLPLLLVVRGNYISPEALSAINLEEPDRDPVSLS